MWYLENLTYADLSLVNLSGAKLYGANISYSQLRFSIIVGVEHESLELEESNFKDAIIDDEDLSNHLSEREAKNVPPALKSKKELRDKLQKRGVSSSIIEHVLSRSVLKIK